MIIYLAAPYAHENPFVIEQRVKLVNQKAAELMMNGYIVFSLISHSHPISKYCEVNPQDQNFWLQQDLPFLKICDILLVYRLEGWDKSKGIRREIN